MCRTISKSVLIVLLLTFFFKILINVVYLIKFLLHDKNKVNNYIFNINYIICICICNICYSKLSWSNYNNVILNKILGNINKFRILTYFYKQHITIKFRPIIYLLCRYIYYRNPPNKNNSQWSIFQSCSVHSNDSKMVSSIIWFWLLF